MTVSPQQVAMAFVFQVFEDHHKTLTPAAAVSFKAVGQQHLSALEQLVAASIAADAAKAAKAARAQRRAAKVAPTTEPAPTA